MSDPVSLLPADSTTPWELAVSLTSAEHRPVDYSGLRDIWDPWQCPPAYLPYLARALGVRVWYDDWPIEKKRRAVARAKEHARATGSKWLIDEYLDLVDAELVQYVAPPQGFVASGSLSPEQWDTWISRMPRVRIVMAEGRGTWDPPVGFVLDLAALDIDTVGVNDGPALYGRRAFLRTGEGGTDISLQLSSVSEHVEMRPAVDYEQIAVPGLSLSGLVLDLASLDVEALDVEDRKPGIYSYALDRTYEYRIGELALSTLVPGYRPLDIRYQRVAERGSAEGVFGLDVDALDVGWLGEDRAAWLLADVLYLHDPEIAAPVVDSISFLDVSRIGMAAHSADVLVRCERPAPPMAFILDVDGIDVAALLHDDMTHVHRAIDAAHAALKLSDKVTVTFEATRPITLGEGRILDQPMPLDARVPNFI